MIATAFKANLCLFPTFLWFSDHYTPAPHLSAAMYYQFWIFVFTAWRLAFLFMDGM